MQKLFVMGLVTERPSRRINRFETNWGISELYSGL
jgi:hypothetical protein